MKKLSLIFLAICSFNIKAQLGTQMLSEEIPESASVTEASVWNTNFSNCFVFVKSHGLTVFNQKTELYLIDSKTLLEKKKIDLPKYKGYNPMTSFVFPYGRMALNQNLIMFYESKDNQKDNFSAIKIQENFNIPDKPEKLFSCDDKDNVKAFISENKEMCMFTFQSSYKKINKKYFHYILFDNNLKLLKTDSVSTNYKNSDTINFLVYENGVAIILNTIKKRSVTLVDVKNNKTNTFDFSHNNNFINIENIKAINNDKIVLLGKYYSNLPDKTLKNGICKIVYNQKTNAIEEQIYFDHIPAGKSIGEDPNAKKNIQKSVITKTGECYVIIYQTSYDVVNGSPSASAFKYELMYVNSDSEKWKKQLPIIGGSGYKINMQYYNNYLYVTYIDREKEDTKLDYNNYVFGSPIPALNDKRSNVSLLKVSANSTILRQGFKDLDYKEFINFNDSEFLGIYQPNNGMVTKKCKFLKVTLNDK